ncbi:uncharacterized protein LOC144120262 [Amblyomma americanum]
MKRSVEKMGGSSTEIGAELSGIKESIDFMNEGFENFKADVEGFRRELAEVKKQNEHYQKTNELLRNELQETKKEMLELKQFTRNINLEIKGLPLAPNEDLVNSVQKVASCLGVALAESDIDVVHRVRSKDKDKPNVVVKFVTRSIRDKVLNAAKKTKLNTRLLGFEEQEPLFVNEHLCVENKVLLSKAKKAAKEHNWKFVWLSQGNILMRRADNCTVLHITSEGDLANVV